jgi:hypothetical protein
MMKRPHFRECRGYSYKLHGSSQPKKPLQDGRLFYVYERARFFRLLTKNSPNLEIASIAGGFSFWRANLQNSFPVIGDYNTSNLCGPVYGNCYRFENNTGEIVGQALRGNKPLRQIYVGSGILSTKSFSNDIAGPTQTSCNRLSLQHRTTVLDGFDVGKCTEPVYTSEVPEA